MQDRVATFLNGRLASGLFVEIGEHWPTVEAQRFSLEAMAACGRPVPEDLSNRVGAFLKRCSRKEGGFAAHAGSLEPVLSSTYYAVRLFELRQVSGDLPKRARVAGWIGECLFDRDDLHEGISVDELYYAVRALQIMQASDFDERRIRIVVDFIGRCASPAGGFGCTPRAAPDIERTYCCVHMLEDLGELKDADKHARWVDSCIARGRVFWDPQRTKLTPATLYWGLRAASILRLSIDWDDAEVAARAFERSEGGFSSHDAARLWDTYCCLQAIRIAAEGGLHDVAYS